VEKARCAAGGGHVDLLVSRRPTGHIIVWLLKDDEPFLCGEKCDKKNEAVILCGLGVSILWVYNRVRKCTYFRYADRKCRLRDELQPGGRRSRKTNGRRGRQTQNDIVDAESTS
jgi:hypothetical protein